MGCKKLAVNPTVSLVGYYLSVQGAESLYMVIHESRQPAFEDRAPLSRQALVEWRNEVNRSTVCKRGERCIQMRK